MKIPEIVVKVESSGCVVLRNDQGTVECPWGESGTPCGSWCPHFEVNAIEAEGHAEHAHVRLTCGQGKMFDGLRVVEPEGKGEGAAPEGTAGT